VVNFLFDFKFVFIRVHSWFRSLLIGIWIFSCLAHASARDVIRIGHFPNVTHAQALLAHHFSRLDKSWVEQKLGSNVVVEWFVFNAGPSSMEAILTGSIDLTYVGPNPAVNAHLRSDGKEIRIVAGACSGGAALVVHPDGRIKSDADFKHKRIGTPQLGNTQDVAARAYFRSKGFRVTLTGGDLFVCPTPNPDQLTLFQRGDLDAVWTIEPWVTRLIREAHATMYLDESTLWPETHGRYVTTHLVSSVRFLKNKPDLLRRWLALHLELTDWIHDHPDDAKQGINQELKAETTRSLAPAVLDQAFSRLEFTGDPIRASLLKSAEDAHRIGFVRKSPDLTRIYDLALLNSVLLEKARPAIQ